MKKLFNFFNEPLFFVKFAILGFSLLFAGYVFFIPILFPVGFCALLFAIIILKENQSKQNEIVRAEYDTENEIMTITLRSGQSIIYSRSKSTWYKMPDYDRVEGKEKLQLLRFYDYNKKFGTYYKK